MHLPPPGRTTRRVVRIVLHLLCMVPAGLLVQGALTGDLGINPVETLTHTAGDWALRLLLLCLAITPLNWLFSAPWMISYRRALGDWAFFYACLHLSVYLLFDAEFDWFYILDDVMERPYITVGATAFILLLPLAITSNKWSQRKLKRNWSRLHRLIYPAAIAVCIHFIWLAKGFQVEPLVYLAILIVLLMYRLAHFAKNRG